MQVGLCEEPKPPVKFANEVFPQLVELKLPCTGVTGRGQSPLFSINTLFSGNERCSDFSSAREDRDCFIEKSCTSYFIVKCGVSVWQSRGLGGHDPFSSLEEQEPRISILAPRCVSFQTDKSVCPDHLAAMWS